MINEIYGHKITTTVNVNDQSTDKEDDDILSENVEGLVGQNDEDGWSNTSGSDTEESDKDDETDIED